MLGDYFFKSYTKFLVFFIKIQKMTIEGFGEGESIKIGCPKIGQPFCFMNVIAVFVGFFLKSFPTLGF